MQIKLLIELIFLFGFVPVILSLDIPNGIKIPFLIAAIVYVIIVGVKINVFQFKKIFFNSGISNLYQIKWRVIVAFILMWLFMYFFNREAIFTVVLKTPLLWISVSLFYAILSAFPQEILYRLFFFERYKNLLKGRYSLMIVNALLFALAHLMFKNAWVLILTFLGGLLFATTYLRTKSTLLTTIEHALYGSWLFALGIGKLLAFPMPD